MDNKKIFRPFFGTLAFLIIPVIANIYIEGFDWSPFDFALIGTLVFVTWTAFELIIFRVGNFSYKAAAGLALLTCLMLFWVTGAVGIIGSEDNPANLMYLGVIALGILGAALTKLQPKGMSYVLYAQATAQLLVPVIALLMKSEFQDVPQAVGVAGVMVLNAGFAFMFALSGILFKNACSKDMSLPAK